MKIEKLDDLESEFLYRYPKGFEDEHFFPTMKKFKPEKLEEFAKEALKTNKRVYDLILEKELVTKEELDELLLPQNMLKYKGD